MLRNWAPWGHAHHFQLITSGITEWETRGDYPRSTTNVNSSSTVLFLSRMWMHHYQTNDWVTSARFERLANCVPSRLSVLNSTGVMDLLCIQLPFIILSPSASRCAQRISITEGPGNTQPSLCNGVDESDRNLPGYYRGGCVIAIAPKYKTNFSQCPRPFFRWTPAPSRQNSLCALFIPLTRHNAVLHASYLGG